MRNTIRRGKMIIYDFREVGKWNKGSKIYRFRLPCLEHFISKKDLSLQEFMWKTKFEWFWLSCLIIPLKWQCTHRKIKEGEKGWKMKSSTFTRIARDTFSTRCYCNHWQKYTSFASSASPYPQSPTPSKRLWDKNNRNETICFVCIKLSIRYSQCEMVIWFELTTY